MHFIFRKSDRVHLYTAQDTPGSLAAEWADCLRNEGGAEGDYIAVEKDGPVPHGMVVTLTDANAVEFVANPERVAKTAKRDALAVKLKAALGLTDEELKILRLG